jgi:putative glutamine amidotransferase
MKHVATWIRAKDEAAFARTFAPYPDLRLHNARIEPVDLAAMDALLLSGGADVALPYLKQPVPAPTLVKADEPGRDEWEFPALGHALERDWPLLAICRGLQVLNVALGGTLHLDIPGHEGLDHQNVQRLRFDHGAPVRFEAVNSSHHQAIDRLADGLVVEGWSDDDDVIEQLRGVGRTYRCAVQYHPERSDLYRPLFDEFAAALRESRRR